MENLIFTTVEMVPKMVKLQESMTFELFFSYHNSFGCLLCNKTSHYILTLMVCQFKHNLAEVW